MLDVKAFSVSGNHATLGCETSAGRDAPSNSSWIPEESLAIPSFFWKYPEPAKHDSPFPMCCREEQGMQRRTVEVKKTSSTVTSRRSSTANKLVIHSPHSPAPSSLPFWEEIEFQPISLGFDPPSAFGITNQSLSRLSCRQFLSPSCIEFYDVVRGVLLKNLWRRVCLSGTTQPLEMFRFVCAWNVRGHFGCVRCVAVRPHWSNLEDSL